MPGKSLFSASVFRFYVVRPVPDGSEGDGVKQLWMAVLQRALQDYFLYQEQIEKETNPEILNRLKKQFKTLLAWLHNPDDSDITSFAGICNALDLDPETLIENIEKLTVADLQKLRRSGGNKCTPTELTEFSLL